MTIVLYEGDNRDNLRAMISRGEFVDSVVCDPPYGLTSVVKRFGKEGSAPARKDRTDGSFSRLSAGFMGQAWDGSAIERDPEFWRLVWEVMKPGAYLVAFSSSRTYHHMAVAIEEAGFITHPMIVWAFGSGFPKAHNAARAIDQALGLDGSKAAAGDPVRRLRPGADQHKDGSWEKLADREYQPGAYIPASLEAKEWDGWHYGGQARKPAVEPIFVGQKPFSEKNGALNILKYGVGAVNIDGCRVEQRNKRYFYHPESECLMMTDGDDIADASQLVEEIDRETYGQIAARIGAPLPGFGRWPANLIHDGSDEAVALFPDSKGAIAPVRGTEASGKTNTVYGEFAGRAPSDRRDSLNGSAARFFESYPFEDRPVFYFPKAGKADRAGSTHPTVKPIALMRALVRHVTPPGGTVLDPFAGSGTTGEAAKLEGARCILMEREPEYLAFLHNRFDFACNPQLCEPESRLGFKSLPRVARAISSVVRNGPRTSGSARSDPEKARAGGSEIEGIAGSDMFASPAAAEIELL